MHPGHLDLPSLPLAASSNKTAIFTQSLSSSALSFPPLNLQTHKPRQRKRCPKADLQRHIIPQRALHIRVREPSLQPSIRHNMNALVFQTLDTEDEKTEKEGERLGEE